MKYQFDLSDEVVVLMMSACYAHARQPKRAAACTRKLRTNLGRIIRQIEQQKHDPKGKPHGAACCFGSRQRK